MPRTSRLARVIGYVGFAAVAAFNVVAASAQKPVKETFMYSDDGFAPPRTVYTFRVIETIKRHGALALDGDDMEVELPGGDIERATHIERLRVPHSRPIQRNHTYVIFFSWNLIQNKLYVDPRRRGFGGSLVSLERGRKIRVDVLLAV
jgi:hypothetical protein